MNLLSAFTFMFEADASSVKKGVTEADDLTKKLEKDLQDADKTTQQLGQNFLKMATAAGKALVAVVALSAIKTATQQTIDNTNAVAMQARAIGVSTEALSLWQNAVKSVGGSTDQATQTITKLAERFRTMGTIGGQSFIFTQLGLSAKEMQDAIKDPTVALVKLSETFGKLSESQRLYLGEKLGLDIGTITLISKGRTELEAYMKRQQELGVVTQEQAYRAAAYKMQLAELGTVYETVRRELTSDFLPALTWLLNKIETVTLYFRDHKSFVIAFFTTIAAVLTAVYLPAVIRAATATWALIAPYVAVALVIAAIGAAIALVVDDIWNFMHGQDSAIGEMAKKWPWVGDIVRGVCNLIVAAIHSIPGAIDDMLVILKAAFDYLAYLLEFVVTVFTKGPQAALDQFNARTKQIMKNLTDHFKQFGEAANDIMKMITDPVKTFGDAWDTAGKNIEKVFDVIKSGPKGILTWLGSKLGLDLNSTWEDPKQAPGKPSSPAQVATGKEIADKLVSSGKWTPAQAAGIAGSFLQESGGKSDAKNPTSGAYGLGQWLGGRRKDFEQYAGKPLEGSSLDEQIGFFNYETTHKEKRAGDMLRAAQTPQEAARIHSQYYERPGAAEANNARREQLAADIQRGQIQIAQADKAPIAAMTSQSIANSTSSSSKTTNVKTGPVTVTTAATDGNGTAKALADGLGHHIRSTLDSFDNGVAA